MLGWLLENLATVVICAVLIFIVACIIIRGIKKKKSGMSACGCGCASCPMSGKCHSGGKNG